MHVNKITLSSVEECASGGQKPSVIPKSSIIDFLIIYFLTQSWKRQRTVTIL